MRESDEALYLRYLRQDDPADLEALLARHREGLFLFLLGIVGNPEDAEDLLMDAFARLAVDRPPFSPLRPGSFKRWLYAIGRNAALAHLRKKRPRTAPLDEGVASPNDLPEVELLKGERNRALYRAISTLKPEYRQALTLLYFEELSHEDIARVMGLRRRQVYHLVERGKESLKKALKGMGMDDARY